MSSPKRSIAPVVTKRRLGEPQDSREWWLSRPIQERIEQVEILRREYYGWDNETEPRLQRVHSVRRRT